MRKKHKIAVIGCGAVAELYHLPVILAREDIEVGMLVDTNKERLNRLAAEYKVPIKATRYQEIPDDIEAALIAVPHVLHAPMAVDLLSRGIHVLVEKPMAMSVADCEAMNRSAREKGAVLAVAMQFRYGAAAQFVHQCVKLKTLGRVLAFDLRWGGPYSWPVMDKAMLTKGTGGGTVTGMGVHFLDLAQWWFGQATEVSYWDDQMGGVEAECEYRIAFGGELSGVIEVSRMRTLRNSWQLRFEKGVLEVKVGGDERISLTTANGDQMRLEGSALVRGFEDNGPRDLLGRLYADFVQSIEGRREPLVSGENVMESIRIMEMGFNNRQAMELPWMDLESPGASLREMQENAVA